MAAGLAASRPSCQGGLVTTRRARIRPRESSDIPTLAAVLLRQQPETRYPFRDPLPIPVEDFLHAHDAVSAWTAELDDQPVGHVCRTRSARTFPEGGRLNEVCAHAHGCRSTELAWVSTLFTAPEARGLGLGSQLMRAVVDDILSNGLHPCLEVLPHHPAAMALYAATGWRTVHRWRPDWLSPDGRDEAPDVHVMVLS